MRCVPCCAAGALLLCLLRCVRERPACCAPRASPQEMRELAVRGVDGPGMQ